MPVPARPCPPSALAAAASPLVTPPRLGRTGSHRIPVAPAPIPALDLRLRLTWAVLVTVLIPWFSWTSILTAHLTAALAPDLCLAIEEFPSRLMVWRQPLKRSHLIIESIIYFEQEPG